MKRRYVSKRFQDDIGCSSNIRSGLLYRQNRRRMWKPAFMTSLYLMNLTLWFEKISGGKKDHMELCGMGGSEWRSRTVNRVIVTSLY